MLKIEKKASTKEEIPVVRNTILLHMSSCRQKIPPTVNEDFQTKKKKCK